MSDAAAFTTALVVDDLPGALPPPAGAGVRVR